MVEHAIGLIKADLPYSSVVKSRLLRAESEMCEINGCPEAADLLRAPAGAVDARAAAAASVGAR